MSQGPSELSGATIAQSAFGIVISDCKRQVPLPSLNSEGTQIFSEVAQTTIISRFDDSIPVVDRGGVPRPKIEPLSGRRDRRFYAVV